MDTTPTTLERFWENAGTLMFLGWSLILGLVGFLLLCALAYAMVTENLALGVVCGMVLFAPPALAVIWTLTAGASLLLERSARKAKEPEKALSYVQR